MKWNPELIVLEVHWIKPAIARKASGIPGIRRLAGEQFNEILNSFK